MAYAPTVAQLLVVIVLFCSTVTGFQPLGSCINQGVGRGARVCSNAPVSPSSSLCCLRERKQALPSSFRTLPSHRIGKFRLSQTGTGSPGTEEPEEAPRPGIVAAVVGVYAGAMLACLLKAFTLFGGMHSTAYNSCDAFSSPPAPLLNCSHPPHAV
eukprot:2196894-Rhodomonas_salina.1